MLKTKIFTIASILFLSSCSILEGLSSAESSAAVPTTNTAKIKACSIEEGMKKVKDGSAFSLGLQASADEISNTCLKKLALEKAGLNTEATETAKSSLQTLMNFANMK